jgi:hypothetical protein
MALDAGVVMNGPFVAAEGAGEIKGQVVKIRRALRGMLNRQAIPALGLDSLLTAY